MAESYCENATVSDIKVGLDVLCRDHEATRHLADFIDEHVVAVDIVAITLRLPGKVFATSRPPLERRVYATLWALRSAADPQQTYSVDLAYTCGTSPFFSGALAIRTSFANDRVSLVLAGHYEPQAGVVGALFNGTFERRVAQASASALLRALATHIEVASARNEAARAGKQASRPPRADYELGSAIAATLSDASG